MRAMRASSTLRCRAGFTCARRNRRSAGAVTGTRASPRGCDRRPAPIDPAPERDHQVARAGCIAPRPRERPRAAATTCTGPAHRFPDLVGERVDGHAGNRVLAGRIDVGEHDFIGERQRRAEVVQQLRGARVAMRLEHAQDPAGAGGARRAQHRRDLGRMMAVVVDDARDRSPRPCVRNGARRRGTRPAPRRSPQSVTPRWLAAAIDRERVEHVVPAGHLERERAEYAVAAVGTAPHDCGLRSEAGDASRPSRQSSAWRLSMP